MKNLIVVLLLIVSALASVLDATHCGRAERGTTSVSGVEHCKSEVTGDSIQCDQERPHDPCATCHATSGCFHVYVTAERPHIPAFVTNLNYVSLADSFYESPTPSSLIRPPIG